jgi:hypothetical protein
MTIEYMTKRTLVVVVGLSFLMSPGTLLAQVGTAAATAVRTAVPTGPMSAVTKAAALVKASKAAAAASRGASTAASSGASRASAVTGYLWTANNSPIQNATVQLRNTVTGNVDMYTKTNAVGEFLFTDMKGGSYVIEYVGSASETVATGAATQAASNASGIMAVGSPFSVAPGETVATFVRSINNVPMFLPDLASNVAQSAVQTAAQAGVTAVVTPIAESAPPAASVVIDANHP